MKLTANNSLTKLVYWTFNCSKQHIHRIDIGFEYFNKDKRGIFYFDVDGLKFVFDNDNMWIDTIFVKKENRIPKGETELCECIDYSSYPKQGIYKKDFTDWEWGWVKKFKEKINLVRELRLRKTQEKFYAYRSFNCRSTFSTSLKDILFSGCKGYRPVTEKTCDNCLLEKQELKHNAKVIKQNKLSRIYGR